MMDDEITGPAPETAEPEPFFTTETGEVDIFCLRMNLRKQRRRYAAVYALPPRSKAIPFLGTGQLAVARCIGEQVKRQGFCRLTYDEFYDLGGVDGSSVRSTIKKCEKLGMIAVERERPSRVATITIVDKEWLRWLNRPEFMAGREGPLEPLALPEEPWELEP